MTEAARRKVCIVVNSRANYGRIKSVLAAVTAHPQLELQLVVGASALLYRFGNVRDVMQRDGYTPTATVYTIVEGETATARLYGRQAPLCGTYAVGMPLRHFGRRTEPHAQVIVAGL